MIGKNKNVISLFRKVARNLDCIAIIFILIEETPRWIFVPRSIAQTSIIRGAKAKSLFFTDRVKFSLLLFPLIYRLLLFKTLKSSDFLDDKKK